MAKNCPERGIVLYLDCLECDDKICKKPKEKKYKYNKIVIGIDESYTKTGISIAADNKILIARAIDFEGCDNQIEKRFYLKRVIDNILKANIDKAKEVIIICERIRTFSRGNNTTIGYIKSAGALIASITDTAYKYNVPVYSVDTRSWKSKILGTSAIPERHKAEIKPEKMLAIEFVESLGFDCKEYNKDGSVKKSVRGKNKGKIKYNDDMADSACIALYGFLPENEQKLLQEQ